MLVLAIGYFAAVIPTLFLMDWFTIDLGTDSIHIGLRSGTGLYATTATSALWGSLIFMIPAVAFQSYTRISTGVANAKLSRYGVIGGLSLIATGLAAGYVFAPELPSIGGIGPEVERTVAPMLFVVANVLGIAALHFAANETTDDDAGAYKPVVIDKPRTPRAPTSQSVPIPRPVTQPPIDKPITRPPLARTPTQSQPPLTTKQELSFLVLSGEVTRAGIDARRADGSQLLVLWRDVVGVVVRRLPDEFEGTTFMDIVSVKGSTLRIVPWTRLTGISVVGMGDDRLRSIASYMSTMCAEVQLFDPATKNFLEKPEPAAQLKDLAKLAAHDERLS